MFTNSHKTSQDPAEYSWFDNKFSEEEIVAVEDYIQQLPIMKGNFGDAEAASDERKSEVRWIYRNEETDWLYEKMISLANTANEGLWQFDMFNVHEVIQYTEYFDNGGHYDWHLDMGPGYPGNQRKISMTVQLSDGKDYSGGEFEMMRGRGGIEQLPKGKGTVLVFPSFLLHRVTPVTRGVRKSLVLWLGGASFK